MCEDVPCYRIVIHDQGSNGMKGGGSFLLAGFSSLGVEPRSKAKGAPTAVLAFHPDGAFHHLYQALRDRKAETGATVFSGCRRIGLAKGLEETRALLRRHADAAVANFKLQLDPIREPLLKPYGDYDFA